MNNQKAKLLLLPVCVLLGTVLLFAFVNFSHGYLSEYFVRNSKGLIGQKVDLVKLAERLGDSNVSEIATNPGEAKLQLSFWSLTCSPCLEKLSKFDPNANTNVIVPINVDPESDIAVAEDIQKKLAPSLKFYNDKNRELMNTFKVDYLPTYVIINKLGFVEEILSGPSIE